MEKLKVVLVDDEILICKLIRMKVDWEALNMTVIAEFNSSRKALESVLTLQPDIIITDICMPVMDGIEFSEECIALLPQVKIIILTGYDEFEYAKKSIHIGVSDYILKPLNTIELTKSLSGASQKIKEERSRTKEYEKLAGQIEENLPAFRENYLNRNLLEADEPEIFRNKMNYYGASLDSENDGIQAAVMEIALPVEGGMDAERDEIILYMQARKLTEEYFSKDSFIFFTRDGIGRIVILCNNSQIDFGECIELLRKMLVTRLKCFVTIGVGSKKSRLDQIPAAYREAAEALNHKVVIGKNMTIFFQELDKDTETFRPEEESLWIEAKIYINAGVRDKAEKCVEKLWNNMEADGQDLGKARNMSLEICTWCLNEAVRREICEKEKYHEKVEFICENSGSWDSYKRAALFCVNAFAGEMSVKEEQQNGSMIHEVIAYMNQNLSDPDLNMNKVAEHVFISSGYLGRILKKHTGKTYGEYLSELRFTRATELLRKTDLKGYEIGEKIGILDSHYLSIWFRKMSGCSLSEYRKKVQ